MALFSLGTMMADAPLRRVISPDQPAWFVHIDNWNNADPQKIIDLIPDDLRPYVVFNISLSIAHDDDTGEKTRVPDGYSTARSWLRTCAENGMWAMVQPASGGYSHFSETDMTIYEEFFREYPNFLGWNYAEQFWGFDDQWSCTFNERLSHFAELMKLSRKYGGYLSISFCGNVWSLALNPLAMMKRNSDFAEQCLQAPDNLIILDKYTMSSMFYEYESTNFGMYVGGYTNNFGIRFDQCGWTAELDAEADNMPAAAGIAPVLNNWMLNGGTVNDGPELIWQQCFKTNGTTQLSDGYTYRVFERFPQFDNVSIDLYRKMLDGMARVPSRAEIVDRHKIVLVNDVNEGEDGLVYGAPNTLYDGLYSMEDGTYYQSQTNWFKSTGRYPTIPIVAATTDSLSLNDQQIVLRSLYDTRWPTIAAKQNEFNSVFPEEYTGNAFASRVANRWLIYNPFKNGDGARAVIPLQYNTCRSVTFGLSQYSNIVMCENTDDVQLYLNNYRTDDTSLKNDTVIIAGCSAKPVITITDRGSHVASVLVAEEYADSSYRAIIAHNGPLDVTLSAHGEGTDRLSPPADVVREAPQSPSVYYGPITHECEDMDYKNTNGYLLAPNIQPYNGFHGLGYHDFGSSSSAALRDTFSVSRADDYDVTLRYCAPDGVARLRLFVGGKFQNIVLPKTDEWEWTEFTVSGVTFAEGKNALRILAYNNVHQLYLDDVTVSDPSYAYPTSMSVDRYSLDEFTVSIGGSAVDSVAVSGHSLQSAVSIVTTGPFTVSDDIDGPYATTLSLLADSCGEIAARRVYVRFTGEELGTESGSVTFSATDCSDHVIELTGTVTPQAVTLIYDFTDDRATSSASTPPATDVSVPTGATVRAGVASYKGSNQLRVYGTSGRNGSGVLDLTRFTSQSTDYSVTWQQYITSTDDYKCGVILRAGEVVGTSTAGYTQGIREGYCFIAYNKSDGSEFRIYKSTSSTSLSMLTNQSASYVATTTSPTWYRATVSGSSDVTLTFEMSTDGESWTVVAQTSDNAQVFTIGATQMLWGLAAATSGFYYDDIVYDGITYDTTGISAPAATDDEAVTVLGTYNMAGQRVAYGTHGVTLRRLRNIDGSLSTVKVIM